MDSNLAADISSRRGIHVVSSLRLGVSTLPILAEFMQRRGKTLKIVPSVVKERPQFTHGTFKRSFGDRILPYRLFRLGLDRLKIKRYDRISLS
ncbi:MAG: hypothetical protein WAU81_08055 [Candidatus Aminicenantales bacterium]